MVKLKAGQPPRSALPFSFAALLRVLAAVQVIPDMMGDLKISVAWINELSRRYGPEIPSVENQAKQLATRIAMGELTPTDPQRLRGDVAPLSGGVPAPNGVMDTADLLLIQRKVLGLAAF